MMPVVTLTQTFWHENRIRQHGLSNLRSDQLVTDYGTRCRISGDRGSSCRPHRSVP